MDSAKAAIKDFLGKSGQHDTTVHEKVAPAVTNETITRTQHDQPTTAVDKEVHQDHYHTSVQPINEGARLPEQHHHKIIPTEHRQFEHGNAEQDRTRVAAEAGKFQDRVTRVEGEHATTVNPAVGGEHHHHHIHETIQPVVNRATVEPHVVHTTVPVHEQHHNAAQHHASSTLPAVSRAEFEKQGGALTGREERVESFAGEPRAIGQQSLGHKAEHVIAPNSSATGGSLRDSNLSGSDRTGDSLRDNNLSSSNRTGAFSARDGTVAGSDGAHATAGGATGSGLGAATVGGHAHTGHTGSHTATDETKPSLADKLNPRKDANNDGKAGFLS